jgi:hypothetical protein
MSDEDNLVDGMTWDEWMALSDTEQDHRVDAAMREYVEYIRSLTPLQDYRRARAMILGTCLRWRRSIRKFDLPVFHDYLRKSQRQLVKRRAQFYHHTEIGEA